jgi:hypothetical protein
MSKLSKEARLQRVVTDLTDTFIELDDELKELKEAIDNMQGYYKDRQRIILSTVGMNLPKAKKR